jgi:iron complex outermembrane receptor protein
LVVTAPKYVPTGETTASKSQTPLVETPQSVTVISRDQIDLLDWSTLGQVVRYTAGVTGENYGPDQRVDWLTVRGFNPVQYIDGLQAAVGSISNVGLDLYGAESVEILKGPSSVLYGATPPGGIVNVTSRRPGDAFGGEIEVQAGNYDHKQLDFDITGPWATRPRPASPASIATRPARSTAWTPSASTSRRPSPSGRPTPPASPCCPTSSRTT